MGLPFLPQKPFSSPREYFFTLRIDHHLVKSAIWSVVNGSPQVLAVGTAAGWDDQSSESLLSACDQSLTDVTRTLDPAGKIEAQKTVLGLPPDWISQGKIQEPKLGLVKSLADKLSLSVIGFVSTPEAVIDHLKREGGVPPTAILVAVLPHHLHLTLVRLGKADGTSTVVRSPHIASDVVEGLSRFTHLDMLPSRILLYDSPPDLDAVKNQLLSHPWQSPATRLPFLHFPKVEILPSEFSLQAISLSAGLEVGLITGQIAEFSGPSSPLSPAPSPAAASDLGFVASADIRDTPPSPPPPPAVPPSPPAGKSRRFPLLSLPRLSLPRLSLPNRFPPLPLFGIPLIIFALFVSLLAAYWYLPTADVTLSVAPQTLTHQFSASADTRVDVPDLSSPTLPAQSLEVTAKQSKSLPTTGSKIIGDKAAGEVTIINGTSVPKTFPSGTILTSPDGLKFLTSSEVLVASASGSADPNSYSPGKSKAPVTAAQIGSESNLSAGTQFKIGSFSSLDFVAKNETAFSGGSSRSVKAVSAKDIESLRSQLTQAVKDQAQLLLQDQTDSDHLLIPESVRLQPVAEDFSHRLDEVTDELTLTSSVTATALAVKSSDLSQIVSAQIESQVPANYSLTDQISYKFTVKSAQKSGGELLVQVTAALLPRLDLESVKTQIAGKYSQPAVDYLKSLPGVTHVDISFPLRLPGPLLTLPRLPGRISISLSPQP